MIVVLVVAAGAGWESEALRTLGEDPGIVVLKRCVDVDDLLATAATGQSDVAVLGLDAPGLDAAATSLLRRHGVAPVVVAPTRRAGARDPGIEAARLHARRLGLTLLIADDEVEALPAMVARAAAETPGQIPGPVGESHDAPEDLRAGPAPAEQVLDPVPGGRIVVVWGPAGAPGRSTVALALAAELARRRRRTVLVDADARAPSLAQQLGILDEVSGLLAAARLAAVGRLEEQLPTVQRALDPRLSIVTGLPRPDRWSEVRPGAVETLLSAARDRGEVVADVASSLEDDPHADLTGRPGRDAITLEALACADAVVAVGAADPVGLARLARGLAELRELVPGVEVHLVVNRMRPSLGWSEHEVTRMLDGFARTESVHFLPDDVPTTDHALVTGRTLLEARESPLSRGVAAVVDSCWPATRAADHARVDEATTARADPRPAPGVARRLRRRRGARDHRR